ncbi:hypothetical protein [Mariprofundus sp. KV]|uniref:hypothetical protein n=1 Tax=Mariprofundus sp. KV TaxID=2608715 RepID=UPI0015A153FD|nr:hypothetical protein [Mariprofundus sp. KV]NWF37257.1 hypothetical protein [Mariprofundus sp. KV]
MSQPEKKQIKQLGLKLFAATLLLTAALFVWSSSNHKSDHLSQDTWVDADGQLHLLGITLGKTVLRDAEIALKSRSDIALYIYPEEHAEAGLKLEAFFPAIADHSKVIVELVADEITLQQMQQRSTLPHLYPNKVARMNLHPEDLALAQQLVVKNLTLIPSITITPETLKARFGEPSTINSSEDGITYYHVAAIGLKATLKSEDATRLYFTNPNQ